MKISEWPAAARLIEEVGIDGEGELVRIRRGGNNRVFHVICGGREALLKAYFHDPGDLRDRLRTEYEMVSFAWERGIRAVPRPLGRDPENHLGLFEFVRGRPLCPDEVDQGAVGQAAELFRALNRHCSEADAASLPNAAEACRSLTEHLELVEERVRRLSGIEETDAISRSVVRFTSDELIPFLGKASELIEWHTAEIEQLGELDRADCKLSPSDFGFHNALLQDDGVLRFFDFEYAGWDDPARVLCDFFWQPALPVPEQFFTGFSEIVFEGAHDPERQLARARLLRPLYGLKWCCIILNDFVPHDARRRAFAGAAKDELGRAQQLAKARTTLQRAREMLEEVNGANEGTGQPAPAQRGSERQSVTLDAQTAKKLGGHGSNPM